MRLLLQWLLVLALSKGLAVDTNLGNGGIVPGNAIGANGIEKSSGAAAAAPTFVSGAFTAVDSANGGGTPESFNVSTIPVTTIAGDIVVMWHHSEFPTPAPTGPTAAGEFYWYATHAGTVGRQIVVTDGYSGGALNRQFRCWLWSAPTTGTNNVVTTCGLRDVPVGIAQELAVGVMVIRGAAQTLVPIRGVTLDVSASNRTGESESVSSLVNDLIMHAIANSLFTRGTLGAGETSRIVANDRPPDAIGDDAGIWISTKVGAAGTTNVSSTGWVATFPVQGMGISVKPTGSAETLNPFIDSFVRANENPLNPASWTTIVNASVTAMKVLSNKAVGTTAGENMVKVASGANTPGGTIRRARFVYAGANFSGPCLLFQGTGASCYTASTSGNDIQIIKLVDVGGATVNYTNVLTTFSVPLGGLAVGDLIELEANIADPLNVVLNLYWNQTFAKTITDSTAPYASGPGGFRVFGASACCNGFEYTQGTIRW